MKHRFPQKPNSFKSIYWGFGVSAGLAVLVGILSLYVFRSLIIASSLLTLDRADELIDSDELISKFQEKVSTSKTFLLTGNPSDLRRAQQARREFLDILDRFKTDFTGPEEKKYLAEITLQESQQQNSWEELIATRKTASLPAIKLIEKFESDFLPKYQNLKSIFKSFRQFEKQDLQIARASFLAATRDTSRIIIGSIGATVLIVLSLGLLMKRTVSLIDLYQKQIEGSNESLERFAYVAAHDLKQPIITMSGYVDLLSLKLEGQLDKDANQYLGFIQAAALRLSRLIDDLLTFSRLFQKGLVLEVVDLTGVMNEVLENLNSTIVNSKATLRIDPLPLVMGSRSQLIQLFQNLIANSIKFRGDRTPQIQISGASSGDSILFAVKDNGIGIPSSCKTSVFEMFKRAHSNYQGSGIGLAMCKKIVEHHGGKIWIDSTENVGTTVYFSLQQAQQINRDDRRSSSSSENVG